MKQTWTKTYTLAGADYDERGICRPSAVLRVLEDAAKNHAAECGAGMEVMLREYNAGWMILRTRLELTAPLLRGALLEVTTWSRGVQGAADIRDYALRSGGELLGRATEVWIVTELSQRRLLNAALLPELRDYVPPQQIYRERPAKLLPHPAELPAGAYTVRGQDIDRNGHMNNVLYVARSLERLPEYRTPPCYLLELNYLKELREGDCLCLSQAQSNGIRTISGRVERELCFLLQMR